MPREHINGIDINYIDIGAGPPVLMLHGFTGSISAWQGIPEALSKHARVIAVDIIGHGDSSAPSDPDRYSIPKAVQDILELLDRLDVGALTVLGYSMGGRIALHLTLDAPDRVSSLILENAAPGIDDPQDRAARVEADEQQARMIERKGISSFIDHWEAMPLFASQKKLPDDVRARQRELRLSQNPTGLANSLRGMGAGVMEPVSDRLQELEMPVLYVAGTHDKKYQEIGQFVCGQLQNARFVEISRAGHTVHLEQPEVYLLVVDGFLDSDVELVNDQHQGR
jgi:2-succinyl-6-hydroxy-2,4-cyclohexadiene-1-carboxylate synthase